MSEWKLINDVMPKDGERVLVRLGHFIAIGQYFSVINAWYVNGRNFGRFDFDEWCPIPKYEY